ncbi:hypothetical protein GW17_00034832 [Ensete ventricosum]|nr:hypothetical protein GW17_00034832 [Ensete ventricosum]
MTSSDSSSRVRVVTSSGSGEANRCDLEVGSLGASSGSPSPVNARVLRDLEVMKADHDLDTTVIEGSLAVIRERYSVPIEYGLHVPQPGQHPYSSDAPDMCISVDALEVDLRFPLHPLIEGVSEVVEDLPQPGSTQLVVLPYCLPRRVPRSRDYPDSGLVYGVFSFLQESGRLLSHRPSRISIWGFRLDWSTHPIDNALSYLSEEESVLVDRLKGILSSSHAIKEMTELWPVEAPGEPIGPCALARPRSSRCGVGA